MGAVRLPGVLELELYATREHCGSGFGMLLRFPFAALNGATDGLRLGGSGCHGGWWPWIRLGMEGFGSNLISNSNGHERIKWGRGLELA